MAKKQEIEEAGKEGKKEETPQRKPNAFEQMRQLGYPQYTFVEKFIMTNLMAERRPFAVAKKVDLMAIKEENGESTYLGLGFVGALDENLFLLVMKKDDLLLSAGEIKAPPNVEYIGLEFFGVSQGFGPVGMVALPRSTYLKFLDTARNLK